MELTLVWRCGGGQVGLHHTPFLISQLCYDNARACMDTQKAETGFPFVKRIFDEFREGLMGVGDRVASVIMLTLQRCPAPMLTQLV